MIGILYPLYTKYIGGISATMFFCLQSIFSVKDFLATTGLRILKCGTTLDSGEFYYVKKAAYCLSVPLFVHFSFSPLIISVADFSSPIGASVFKLCTKLDCDEFNCVIKSSHILLISLFNCSFFLLFQ